MRNRQRSGGCQVKSRRQQQSAQWLRCAGRWGFERRSEVPIFHAIWPFFTCLIHCLWDAPLPHLTALMGVGQWCGIWKWGRRPSTACARPAKKVPSLKCVAAENARTCCRGFATPGPMQAKSQRPHFEGITKEKRIVALAATSYAVARSSIASCNRHTRPF